MPAFFCLGLHDALVSATARLNPGEHLVAYLDDVYIVSGRDRAKATYDILTQEIRDSTGIEPNLGKTECWANAGGPCPPGIELLDAPSPAAPVWKGNLEPDKCGLEILGAPLGTQEYTDKVLADKLQDERKLLDKLPEIPHLQVSWLLMYFCASPRANFVLRTVPPSLCRQYAQERDALIRGSLAKLFAFNNGYLSNQRLMAQIHLPARFGGLGLNSSVRTSQAAYWASWCDVISPLLKRIPSFEHVFGPTLNQCAYQPDVLPVHAAMRNLHEAALLLVDEGFGALPSWSDLAQGITPPAENSLDIEPGESRKGWQRLASTCREKHHYERYMQSLDASSKARLRSSAGPNSSRWLYAIPSGKQFQLTCPLFRCAVQRRLGMKVDPAAAMCEGCHAHLDGYGWHRTTCMRTGRVQVRHKPLLHVWQRIFREAGVPIAKQNFERLLRTTHIRRGPNDLRRMDLISAGIDGIYNGSPLFMDATIVSPLHGTGIPMPNSRNQDGAALARADRKNRQEDYPDVEASSQGQLLCLGVETYGRWSPHCLTLVRQLAKYKSRNCLEYLQTSIQAACYARWWNMLAVQVQIIVGESILRQGGNDLYEADATSRNLTILEFLDSV